VKLITCLLALILPACSIAQVKVSTCQPRYQNVAAPARAIQINPWTVADHYSLSGRWGYPFDVPNPAGTFEICNAIVDKQQKVGAWSQPKTLTLQSGWRLNGGSWNQPPSYNDAGIVWKIKTVCTTVPNDKWPAGKEYLLTTNYECDTTSNWCLAPWSSTTPVLQQLRWPTYGEQYFSLAKLTYGGSHTTVAPAPFVVATQLQLVNMQVAYCYEANNGETELSPAAQFTVPPIANSWQIADTCQFGCMLQDPLPMGALGYRIYVKLDGQADWKRVPAPHCLGEPDPAKADDWRWQPDDQMIILNRAVDASYPTHQPVANPQSWFTKLQAAMVDNPGKAIEVDEETVLYCPVIHDLGENANNVGRKIAGPADGQFKVRQDGTDYWPAWVNYSSYTKVIGLNVLSNGSAALAFASPTGSCSFGCTFKECSFGCQTRTDAVTQGMRVRQQCAGVGGHSASELLFTDCNFNAPVPLWIEHTQTANVQCDRVHANSFFQPNRQHAALWIDTPNTLRLKNGCYLDCPGNAVFNTIAANIIADELWVDQGAYSFLDCHQAASSLKINTGKLNVRTKGTGQTPNLVRNFNTVRPSICKLTDIVTQFDPDTPSRLECLSYQANHLGVLYDGGNLGESITLREPTVAQAQAEANTIYGQGNAPSMDYPRQEYRVQMPAQTIPVSPIIVNDVQVPGSPVVVPASTIYFNSLTGGAIKRISWKD
jgi:hypothetical protein